MNSLKSRKKIIFGSIFCVILLFILVYFLFLFLVRPQPSLAFSLYKERVKVDSEIYFDFILPVSRHLEINIEPEMPGQLSYENGLFKGHLFRRVKFAPEFKWQPDTEYKVSLKNIKEAFPSFRKPINYTFSFKTEKLPQFIKVEPSPEKEIKPEEDFIVSFDKNPDSLIEYNFFFEPEVLFRKKLDWNRKSYIITPEKPLSQGSKYTLKITGTKIQESFLNDEIVQRGEKKEIWQGEFKVREAPYIKSFSPTGDNVEPGSEIVINFSEAVDFDSFLKKVVITPDLSGSWQKKDEETFSFKSKGMLKDMQYSVVIKTGLKTKEGGFFAEDSIHSFTTKGPLKLVSSSPAAGDTGVLVSQQIKLEFNGSIASPQEAQDKFSITPAVSGKFSWQGNSMIFIPDQPLDFNQTYTVSIAKGIESNDRYASESEYNFSFTTELSITKLDVPFHRQEHNLSCEVASLLMALSYKGVKTNEAELINIIGFDPTPKKDGVWGNPHIAFVGDIDGHQPSTGYGVYWQPVAKAGSYFRPTRWFTGGNLRDLTSEIKKGNPVVVWGTAGTGRRIDWKTPQGGNVVAVSGEHARVVIGYIGSMENPSRIITLDPLAGERYFSRQDFLWNWGLLNKSGVVVE